AGWGGRGGSGGGPAVAGTGEGGGRSEPTGTAGSGGGGGGGARHWTASFHTGERRAKSSHSSGMPSATAWAATSGSFGSRKSESCAPYRSRSSGVDATSSTRSAS